jgi:GTP-binding protein
MIFTVALIGAPNVGKSTLFNRLVGGRKILEHGRPGTTRDRQFGMVKNSDSPMRIVDCGGWTGDRLLDNSLQRQMQQQTEQALAEADAILVLFDGQAGITETDKQLIPLIRKQRKPIVYAVNKADNDTLETHAYEFYTLGIDNPIPCSALHNRNIDIIIEALQRHTPSIDQTAAMAQKPPIRICFMGRPNTGKSTLINTLCGEERMIVNPEPGTTRDATRTSVSMEGIEWNLIDTPGLRRKRKPRTPLEGLMQITAQKALEDTDIVCLLLDGVEGLTAGDIAVCRMIADAHRACIICINKWDIVAEPEKTLRDFMDILAIKVSFLRWAPVVPISAKTKLKVNRLVPLIRDVYRNYTQQFDQQALDQSLASALHKHPLQRKGQQLLLRRSRQIRSGPPVFHLEITHAEMLHFSYFRFFENTLRAQFELTGSPVIFKTDRKKK